VEGEPVRHNPVVLDDQAVQVAFLSFDEIQRGHCVETGLRHALQMQLVQDQKSTSFLDAFIEFSHHLHMSFPGALSPSFLHAVAMIYP
jgi:hypothetical protein